MRLSSAVVFLFSLLGLAGPILAGGSPETTLLVINGDSALSVRVANAYGRLRDIPYSHRLWLRDVPSLEAIGVETFRERIWAPIRAHLEVTGLADRIDTIAYSADFPYAVDLQADTKANGLSRNPYRGNSASLTGVTYFARRVEGSDSGYLRLDANQYFRRVPAKPQRRVRSMSASERGLRQAAAQAFKAKDFETARQIYSRLTRSVPERGRNWFDLARSLAALERAGEAEAALEKALEAGWRNSVAMRGDKYLRRLAGRRDFAGLLVRMDAWISNFEPAQGFRSRYQWHRWGLGQLSYADAQLDRYYLSTLLAYTGERGNSFREVMGYLSAARRSDGTRPAGRVYLMENNNIRSQTRQPFFPITIQALTARGRSARILASKDVGQDGILPIGKKDVIGLVAGARRFDWQASESRLLPGAIAEALTSYGGDFNRPEQTKLTEFLRYGAAGSSGAVAEPYNFQAKFPLPLIHVYYADGCSLAEAFYQSLGAPYQLLIVGDPLARPFAEFAQVELITPDPDSPWAGEVEIRVKVQPAPNRPIRRVELWVDGRHWAETRPGEPLHWDTRRVDDGIHELRLVAVEAGPIETHSYAKSDVRIANGENRLAINAVASTAILGDKIDLSGTAPGARRVEVYRGGTRLGSVGVEDGSWRLSFSTSALGLGTTRIFARAQFPEEAAVRSGPIAFDIHPPVAIPAAEDMADSEQGLAALFVDHEGQRRAGVMEELDGVLRESNKPIRRVKRLSLSGQFRVSTAGFYQLAASARGRLRLVVDGRVYVDGERPMGEEEVAYIPFSLAAGWHDLAIELEPTRQRAFLRIVLAGDQPGAAMGGAALRHRRGLQH